MRFPSLLLAAAFVLGAPPALACSCRCQADAAAFVREVPIFFRGRPVAETVEGAVRSYSFAVSVVHKGDAMQQALVKTPAESAACGVQFVLDREALVGVRPSADGLHVNSCTQFCIAQKQAEIEALLARCVRGAPCPPER